MQKELMTLQELTDKLQTLCHSGHAQKTVVLFIEHEGQSYGTIPFTEGLNFVTAEESVGINFGEV